MGLFGKKDGIICQVCKTQNAKLLRKYLKEKKHPKVRMVRAGGIVVGAPVMDAVRMRRCLKCQGYFCENCMIDGYENDDRLSGYYLECPVCHQRLQRNEWEFLKEYE